MDKVHGLLASIKLVVLFAYWTKPGKSPWYGLIVVSYVTHVCVLNTGCAAEYEWSCTERDNGGQRYIPSIRRDLDQNVLTMATVGGELNIYHLSDLEEACYGSVVEIEYCYQFNNTTEGPAVFNWTVLIFEQTQSSDFIVKIMDTIIIESCALYANCMSVPGQPLKEQCCDTTVVPEFELSMNFTFGVTESAQGNTHDATLLGFHHSQYRVNAIRLNKARQSLTIGSTVDLSGVSVEPNSGLRMLWFIIG